MPDEIDILATRICQALDPVTHWLRKDDRQEITRLYRAQVERNPMVPRHVAVYHARKAWLSNVLKEVLR